MVTIIMTTGIFLYVEKGNEYEKMNYKKFTELLDENKVEKVTLSSSPYIKVILDSGKEFKTQNPRIENFKEKLLLHEVEVIEEEFSFNSKNIISIFIFLGVLVFFVYYGKKGGGAKSAQKEITDMANIDINNDEKRTRFKNIAGNEEAKESLVEIVDFIKNPDKYEKYGARIPRGVLLYGSPGTGKTLLAKAVSGEASVPFFPVNGSDFIQVYAGVGASRIRSLFKKARKLGKAVIFIDEIDALGKNRKNSIGGNDESDRTLNALLTEMSGFNENQGIVVIGATNRIDILDKALLRPGRFDRQIEVGLPDRMSRYNILKLHGLNKPLDKSVNLMELADKTVYFSGAKLENLMNESAIIAARNNDEFINMSHIDKAFYSMLIGSEKKDKSSISVDEKSITAYHEAGHALISKLICPENRVTKVSIIPSTKGAGGFTMNIYKDKMYQTKRDIEKNIMVSLAGRAAEELVFGEEDITTGASNDLERATMLSLKLVSKFGMDKNMGLLSYERLYGNNIVSNEKIIGRVKEKVEELYEETKSIIKDNLDILKDIAKGLMEYEMLDESQLESIINT